MGTLSTGLSAKLGGGLLADLYPEASAFVAANNLADGLAIQRVQEIIRLLKSEEVFELLSDGWLFGSKFQASHSTLKSLPLNREASGASTAGEWGATHNGTSDGYTHANVNREAASTGFAWITLSAADLEGVYKGLLGSYNPTTERGPYLTIGYTGTSDDAKTAARFYTSTDGTASPTYIQRTNDEFEGDWSYTFAEWNGTTRTLAIDDITPTTDTPASVWNDHDTMGVGQLSNGAFPFDGRIMLALIFSEAIGYTKFQAIRDRLRQIFSSTIPLRPAVIFDGNSLTASAPGGGTNYPTQLLGETGWDAWFLDSQNYAVSGDKLLDDNLPRLPDIINAWRPYASEDRLLIAWPAINDVSAGTSSAAIIAAYTEYLTAASEAGFRVVALTLTPVASNGDGTSYTYSPEQQATRTAVNDWLLSTGATIADQVVDLNDIADTYPEFSDPTDSTYYVTGDGLHHNDAGRGLVAEFVAAEVTAPSYTPF